MLGRLLTLCPSFQESTASHPRLHAVWDKLLARFAAPAGDDVAWPQFWLAVVDGTSTSFSS